MRLEVLFKHYTFLKHGGSSMDFISSFLKDHGYENETLWFRTMERLGLAPKGIGEKEFFNFPFDPHFESENQPENKDDDERIFINFQLRMGVTAEITGERTKLFRSKEHKRVYAQMFNRGVINLPIIDFDFLDSIKVNLREELANLQLEKFCA